MDRVAALRNAFNGAYDGYLIFNPANMLYFTGVPGTTALLIPPEGEGVVYVSSTNYEQAKAQIRGFNVKLIKPAENLLHKVAVDAKQLLVHGLLVDVLGVDSWRFLTKDFSNVIVDGIPIVNLRAVKDADEILLMRKAAELTSKGMQAASEAIKLGMRECEVAGEVENAMRKGGGGPTAFESIVASGVSTAYPHGGCSQREIQDGDLVMVDIGATFDYYCSDMTRTYVAGKPTERQQQIYDVVKRAQDAAFDAMQPDAVIADVDAAARGVICAAGFGEFFVHRVGHGVGLEVHEPPSMHALNKDTLKVGNVVTDEPGVYLPGFGGIRIEDTVLITVRGPERLTRGPYRLTNP